MLERGDDAGGGEGAALGRDPCRRIEADRRVGLAGIEVAHIVDARARDGIENVLGEIAVRVDDGNTFPRVDVAHREIEEDRALARSGFADDPHMTLALLAREDNACAACCCANRKRLVVHNVAPASGENPCCLRSPRLPSCALPYLWRSGLGAARRATHDEVLSAIYQRKAPRRETWSLQFTPAPRA